jgi:predicted nucleic acid-binding protein
MAALIDSCVLIDIERERFRLEDLETFGPAVVGTITSGELAMGIELMPSASKRARRHVPRYILARELWKQVALGDAAPFASEAEGREG